MYTMMTIPYKYGQTLAAAEYGDKNGFPILIQHGLIASIRDGGLFGRLMELGARLICPARPGYGESTPYEMDSLAEWGEITGTLVGELGLGEFDILGMSSGAPYSYAIGYTQPEKVRNIFILSGTPALYDELVLAHWPYPVNRTASLAEMELMAQELFFSGVREADLDRNDIRDSMRNRGFGVAQDLRLRGRDWGFRLEEVRSKVFMRHSKRDEAVPFVTAELTAKLLPNCTFVAREDDEHFSEAVLDDFIRTVMARHYQ
jgi:pimeloyl-ACP methyl ester carboxylesterase